MTIRLEGSAAEQADILGMLRMICPEGDLSLNPDGAVRVNTEICSEPNVSCRCVCHLISLGTTTRIRISPDQSAYGGGSTTPAKRLDTVSEVDGEMGPGSESEIEIENQNRWNAPTLDDPPAWIPEPDWMILAHELCGHAIHFRRGDHARWPATPPADRDWRQQTRAATAAIRRERGLPPVDESNTSL